MDNLENGLPLFEKTSLTEGEREYLIHILDNGYQQKEPLALHLHIFTEYPFLTRQDRNKIILESDYRLDDDLVSMLVLFG